MKKKLLSLVLCFSLLSALTVSASADFTSTDSSYLFDIYRQVTGNASFDTLNDWIKKINSNLGFLYSAFSDTRSNVNPVAYYAKSIYEKMSTPKDYSTVLSNIKTNTDTVASYIKTIDGDTGSISARATELLNKLNDVYVRQGVAQIAITNHIDSASAQNHSDFNSLLSFFDTLFTTQWSGPSSDYSLGYRFYFSNLGTGENQRWLTLGGYLDRCFQNLWSDVGWFSSPTLYRLVHQLQQVLASDDDLALKNDNKANEEAATSGFVSGSSSKTSLGAGDFGNLKDVGGSFNDLTSLNGQSSVSSFLSGLSSADGAGQGWFSEATRASLDAVSTPVTTTNLVRKTWRGEKSLVYSISYDTSVNVVASPAPARAPAADLDPYNMSGFEDNYNWLWGDAS